MSHSVTIGCDPELFVYKGDVPVSSHDLLPGTKNDPMAVPKGAIQVDGVAAEFNIDPAHTRDEFIDNIRRVRRILNVILAQKGADYVLRAEPTVFFQKSYFKKLPPEVLALGCEPDYNAYTGKPNPKPETSKPMRTGSGHVHIGWSGCDTNAADYKPLVHQIVQELDFVLYRQSLEWDTDELRRELYGAPGAFRYKPYGLEYRVLSNKWLDSEGLMGFVHDCAKNVTTRILLGEQFARHFQDQCKYTDYLKVRRLPMVQEYLSV